MIGIYKITNPMGKIYVGQSVNIEERKYQYKYLSKYSLGRKIFNSIKKYGWEQHKFEIIEECNLEQLDEREIFWGGKFNVLGCNEGLNLKLGDGRGLCSEETKQLMSKRAKEIMTEEHRKKLSNAQMGISKTEEHKKSMRVPKKNKDNYKNNVGKWAKTTTPVIQYDLQGNKIKEWSSQKEAGEKLNFPSSDISACCIGKQKTARGFIWKYKYL